MKKKTQQTINRTIVAIAIIVLGCYLSACHLGKTLPFGIESENLVLWILWAYGGLFMGPIVATYGGYLLFYKQINKNVKRIK